MEILSKSGAGDGSRTHDLMITNLRKQETCIIKSMPYKDQLVAIRTISPISVPWGDTKRTTRIFFMM